MLNILKKLFQKGEAKPRIEWTEDYKQSVCELLSTFIQRGKDISHQQTMLLMETGEESSPEIQSQQRQYMTDLNANETFLKVIEEAREKVYAQFACEEMQCELNNRWGKEDKRKLKSKARKINSLIEKGKAKDAADYFRNSTSELTICVLLKSLLKREFNLVWYSQEELALSVDSSSQIII